jgi:uncharacterized protein (DUF2384 family)
VFDTDEKAALWLETPLSDLGERTPAHALGFPGGLERVLAILDRIDYVVYG